MKAFISALVLLAILVGTAFITSSSLTKKAERLSVQAAALEDVTVEARENAATALISAWEAERFAFTMTINHNEIDALDGIFARLDMSAKTKDDDDFLIAASEVTALLSHIRDLCAVSWDNIL